MENFQKILSKLPNLPNPAEKLNFLYQVTESELKFGSSVYETQKLSIDSESAKLTNRFTKLVYTSILIHIHFSKLNSVNSPKEGV